MEMWTGKGHFGNLVDYCLRQYYRWFRLIREIFLVVTYSYEGAGEGVEQIDLALNLSINITSWGFFLQKQICKDMLTAFLLHTDWWTEQEKVPAGEDLGTQCLKTPAAWVHKDVSVHCSCLPVSKWAQSLWDQLLWLRRFYILTGTESNLCKWP